MSKIVSAENRPVCRVFSAFDETATGPERERQHNRERERQQHRQTQRKRTPNGPMNTNGPVNITGPVRASQDVEISLCLLSEPAHPTINCCDRVGASTLSRIRKAKERRVATTRHAKGIAIRRWLADHRTIPADI
jgi:hypothetical protein